MELFKNNKKLANWDENEVFVNMQRNINFKIFNFSKYDYENLFKEKIKKSYTRLLFSIFIAISLTTIYSTIKYKYDIPSLVVTSIRIISLICIYDIIFELIYLYKNNIKKSMLELSFIATDKDKIVYKIENYKNKSLFHKLFETTLISLYFIDNIDDVIIGDMYIEITGNFMGYDYIYNNSIDMPSNIHETKCTYLKILKSYNNMDIIEEILKNK